MLYKLNLSEVCISLLGRTNENPPWRHDGRKTDYHHLILIVSGSCECRIANRTYNVHAGDLLFIPAKIFYRLTTADHCEYCFACFFGNYEKAEECDRIEGLRQLPAVKQKFFLPSADTDTICLLEHTSLATSAYSNLLTLFTRGQSLSATGRYLDRLMIDILFQEILLSAANVVCSLSEPFGKETYPIEKLPKQTLNRMLKYIDQNYTERISPESLAKHFDLSREHICALFRDELDMTVSEYCNTVKLNHAVELLSNSSMNVSQISEYLGYSSVYYFSRLFKKRYGVSPTGYVEQ